MVRVRHVGWAGEKRPWDAAAMRRLRKGETQVRVMLLMYPGEQAESRPPPDQAATNAGMDFNQRLIDAGVFLEAEGVYPSAHGARVRFSKGKPMVIHGRFTETKEVFGGYWILNVASLAEAAEWASKAPLSDGGMIEIRRMISSENFNEGTRERESKMKQQMARKNG